MGAGDLWLLIGNSRWHWVEALAEAASDPGSPVLRFSHSPPPPDPALLPWERLRAWAAVGPVPFQGRENTCQLAQMEGRRLQLEQVPLQQLPPWLGIDRALVGWQAWQRQGQLGRGAVLVADAGTALSLTRIGATGAFAGGRLQPGVSTQLSCLGRATELLPLLVPGPEGLDRARRGDRPLADRDGAGHAGGVPAGPGGCSGPGLARPATAGAHRALAHRRRRPESRPAAASGAGALQAGTGAGAGGAGGTQFRPRSERICWAISSALTFQ